jgi:phage shock protein C
MSEKNWLQTLTKSGKDKWIGGVCGGLGEHSPVPSWCWRLFFVLLFMLYGTGLMLYVLLWIFLPKEAE